MPYVPKSEPRHCSVHFHIYFQHLSIDQPAINENILKNMHSLKWGLMTNTIISINKLPVKNCRLAGDYHFHTWTTVIYTEFVIWCTCSHSITIIRLWWYLLLKKRSSMTFTFYYEMMDFMTCLKTREHMTLVRWRDHLLSAGITP